MFLPPKKFFTLFMTCLKSSDDVDSLFHKLIELDVFTAAEEDELHSEYFRKRERRMMQILRILDRKTDPQSILCRACRELAKGSESRCWFDHLAKKVEQSESILQ